MGLCIEKLPCPCGNSRRGLQVFADEETGKINGHCFSCDKHIPDPYGEPKVIDDVDLPEPKSEEEIQEEIAEILTFPTVDVKARRLRAANLQEFGILTSLSEQDGRTPTRMYFPQHKEGKLSGFYVKVLGNKEISPWAVGDVKGVEPFGWQRARKSGAYTLVITEGMEDAVAVESIMQRFDKDTEYPTVAISLTNGASSVDKNLAPVAREIEQLFKRVIICFDDDKAGQDAVSKAMIHLPNAVTVTLPEKDANDCILKGAQKQAYTALRFRTEKPKNTRIISINDVFDAAEKPAEWGQLSWPFAKMQDLTRGLRFGETIYIGAAPKMGKSELVNALGEHFVLKDGVKIFMAKPEESNVKTTKLIAGKAVGKVFHDPKVPFDQAAFRRARDLLSDKVYMVDLYQHVDWSTLRQDIVYAAKALDVKVVFIDPITNLTNGMESATANVKLQEIAQDASSLALDLGIVIFIFCHLKSPNSILSDEKRERYYNQNQYTGFSGPHEKGGEILSSQFAGSRAMMRSCNYMFGLEGNKDENLPPEIRNSRWLRLLEDREFGEVGSSQLYWNQNTTLFTEV